MSTTTALSVRAQATGLSFKPVLGRTLAFDYELRDALITNSKGDTVFEQKCLKFPKGWSQMAVNIVASKYFHGKKGSSERENSLFQLVDRVVETISGWGLKTDYFTSAATTDVFEHELRSLLIGQYVAFNSPVWFNVGVERVEPNNKAKNFHWNSESKQIVNEVVGYTRPQCSACFINSVEDSMESILDLAKTEGMLFKWGSGTGTNLSPLRSSLEQLAGGGVASGPVSFMRGYDAFAGVIKSGGTTRRAAKMVILNASHPDIEEFILCKGKEEAKAHALMSCGYDGTSGPESEAYLSVSFQNANNSVRVTDEFMEMATVEEGVESRWDLTAVKDGRVIKTVSARGILRKIAEQTWKCGDPGMQFDTTINDWHTCKQSARINASNPCSEYMFLDDTACNLASFNLLKFYKDGKFDVDLFKHAIRIVTVAMDIIVDGAGYPTELIAKNSHDYRPLGLGYANLGALLMEMGYAYDSDEGRNVAALITSIMSGQAYETSSEMARECSPIPAANSGLSSIRTEFTNGTFPGYERNDGSFMQVMEKHLSAAKAACSQAINSESVFDKGLLDEAYRCWERALTSGYRHGYRNSQVTVLAPTGTIGFMMDCDTTGIEPMMSLVTYKKMVGGGFQKLTYPVVERTLRVLGYDESVDPILAHIEEHGTVIGSAVLDEHLAIFDCALAPTGGRQISWLGHVRMMEVTQPFLSGAISKTVNMPEGSTVQDIFDAYVESWKRGLKAVAIYRDGSKKNQVMVTRKDDAQNSKVSLDVLKDFELVEISAALWSQDRIRCTDLAGNIILPGVTGKILPPFGSVVDRTDEPIGGLVPHSVLIPLLEHLEPGEISQELRGLMEALLGTINKDFKREAPINLNAPPVAVRHKLADTRQAVVHKFAIANHEGYLHVGLYPNGQVGEIFITMAKEGSTLSGIMDAFATAVSIGLQHGVPLATLVDKMSHTRFEPSGWAHDQRIGYAKSIMDYIFRWLKLEFLDPKPIPEPLEDYVVPNLEETPLFVPAKDQHELDTAVAHVKAERAEKRPAIYDQYAANVGKYVGVGAIPHHVLPPIGDLIGMKPQHVTDALAEVINFGDSPSCSDCGAIMARSGSCYRCMSCGGTSGCS